MPSFLLLLMLLFAWPAFAQEADAAEESAATEEVIRELNQNLQAIQRTLDTISTNAVRDEGTQTESLERARQDLVAQQEMAEYTRLVYIVTALEAIVGVFTVIGLITTIYQTSNIIKQDRAWVCFTSATMTVEGGQDEDGRARIVMRFTNSGKTPALCVVEAFAAVFLRDDEAKLPSFDFVDKVKERCDPETEGLVCAPGGHFLIQIPLQPDQVWPLLEDRGYVVAHTTLAYKDVYKRIRWTQATIRMDTYISPEEAKELADGKARTFDSCQDLSVGPIGEQNSVT